jgi:uncharacterized protein (DUF427 family)
MAMKQPGPAHPIEISPFGGRVRIRFAGHIIADSSHALRLEEASYKPVFYIPRSDAHMEYLSPSGRVTHCPYKGDAHYFSLVSGTARERDAAWSYETPFPAVAEIAGHLAFYPDKVEIEAVPRG